MLIILSRNDFILSHIYLNEYINTTLFMAEVPVI